MPVSEHQTPGSGSFPEPKPEPPRQPRNWGYLIIGIFFLLLGLLGLVVYLKYF